MDGCGNNFAERDDGSVKVTLAPRSSGTRQRMRQDAKETHGKVLPVLPSIPAATQTSQKGRPQKSSEAERNPLALLSSESRATAARNTMQERWRSALLEYEVALRELVTNSINEPPSDVRITKTLQVYDAVARVVADQSPELADMMKMFRVEFCRATFSNRSLSDLIPFQDADGAEEELDDLGRTYFDQVSVLLRENAALRVEVSLGNTRDNLAQMKQKIEHLVEVNSHYENELNRLVRENELLAENYRKAREELRKEKERNQVMVDTFDDEKERILQENKDMQLRLCRLRKYLGDRESTVVKDAYKQLKGKKMEVMTQLFEEGDERVSILVMLSQLETRVNEELDNYDREALLCDESELAERQQRMLSSVSVLLEEMHLSEERYLRLVPNAHLLVGEEQDETDGYISLLSDKGLYEALVARAEARERSLAVAESDTVESKDIMSTMMTNTSMDFLRSVSGTVVDDTSLQMSPRETKDSTPYKMSPLDGISLARPETEDAKHERRKEEKVTEDEKEEGEGGKEKEKEGKRFAELKSAMPKEVSVESLMIIRRKQEEWVANIFGTAVDKKDFLKRILKRDPYEGTMTEQEHLMRYFISKPMLDVSDNKFRCGIDIFTGPGPLTQSFLCSVMYVDPVEPLQVPQGSNFMHLKYRNPLRIDAVSKDPLEGNLLSPNTEAIEEWGGKTSYVREVTEAAVPELAASSHLFAELRHPSILKAAAAGVNVASSSTPSATTFLRLNPLSPNRSPEWLLYQSMFGGYRPLAPRLIDISYIDHILLNSCERHFDRSEERYSRCFKQARGRATNSQKALNMAERFFKDTYALTDFQESIIRELESRYCYPELVAKSLYEILCFLDATMASQPLVDLYLSCIRGFESPTRIHYITYVLHQISVNWPSSNPEEPVLKEDVLTLLEYIYKKASGITSMEASEILTEYHMATRSAPITLNSLRSYLVTAMLHFEDPLLLYFNGLLSYNATSSAVVEMNYEQFELALKNRWEEKIEGKLLIRYLAASCGFNKKAELTTKELACVATSMWSSHLWSNM
ncbi:hypothetical protein MOQ_004481 [Trypanosoma cruzi marinkellei]|uniref:Uncharacterized protein n=1 Tax=Trypanosoma cruzi marinkellei TaxID=85056 RepID=K2N142_TRYCR|nr:hypothetical protein MOQ_004481 [Trypanosoma cruzi marinkellei]